MNNGNNPPIGQKVFIPELQIWGEIVEYYDNNKNLITRVRAMVNGKPALIDVTNLIVDLAGAVQAAAGLWPKVKAALKSLCKKIGFCKPKVAFAVVPNALEQTITMLEMQKYEAQYIPQLAEKYGHQIDYLKSIIP